MTNRVEERVTKINGTRCIHGTLEKCFLSNVYTASSPFSRAKQAK